MKRDAYTLWLFTASDVDTVLLPCTILGIVQSLTHMPSFDNADQFGGISYSKYVWILQKSLAVLGWVWLNLVPLTISNQRSPMSVIEDKLNKPWRPLPSGRLTATQAKWTMLAFYVVAQLYCVLFSGGTLSSFVLTIMGTWYNKFKGGEYHPLLRNMINAAGYLCLTSGAAAVALTGTDPNVVEKTSNSPVPWPLVITAIIISTMHIQDMYDQEGDSQRGRRTVPLMIGDGPARWTLATAAMTWGIVCPLLASVGSYIFMTSFLLNVVVAGRMLLLRSVPSDRQTYRIWNSWMTLVFIMPIFGKA